MQRPPLLIPYLILIPAALLAAWAGLMTGSYDLAPGELLRILAGGPHPQADVVLSIRLPRLVQAFATGAALALGGILMQALLRNPLAEPYIMGLTAGAGLGVNLLILGIIPVAGYTLFTYPLFAAAGGALSLMLVMGLGQRSLHEDNARLLIAGVAVSAICTALSGLLIYLTADSDQIRQVVFWSFGSFGKATGAGAWTGMVLATLGVLASWMLGPALDVLALGAEPAASLGMRVARVRAGVIALAALVTGGVVAFAGPVGFVGMIVPHVARAWIGGTHRRYLAPACVMGGTYLTACDWLSRLLLPPAGLPIGIVTALLGAPFFIFLLFSRRRTV